MKAVKLVTILIAAVLAAGCQPGERVGVWKDSLPGVGLPEAGMPDDDQVPQWRLDGRMTSYRGQHLQKYLSRFASTYFNYGFEYLVVADYVHARDNRFALAVETYKMRGLRGSAGVFYYHRATKLEGEGQPVRIGADAVIHDKNVYFYKGDFFVKCIFSGRDSTDFPQEDALAMARAIAGNLPGDTQRPRAIQYLEVKGVNPATIRLTPGYTFDLDFLPAGTFAKAPEAGPICDVFVVPFPSPTNARNAAVLHQEYLQGTGVDFVRQERNGREVWQGRDMRHGRVIMTTYGSWIVGAQTPYDYGRGEMMIERIIAGMGRQAGPASQPRSRGRLPWLRR